MREENAEFQSETRRRARRRPLVAAGAFVPLLAARRRRRPPSLEHVLQHGGGVGGPRLPALDGAAQVLDAAAALPDLLELARQDLSPPLPGQTGLLQTQLAHLHVVLSCNQHSESYVQLIRSQDEPMSKRKTL